MGEDPDFHMKLGRGGMSDVEWTVQLLQMEHGHTDASIRSPSTLEAVAALQSAGILDRDDATALADAYRFCAAARNRLFLREGRSRDSLPSDPEEAARLARSLGFEINPRSELREEYRRVTRRARRVMERVFYYGPRCARSAIHNSQARTRVRARSSVSPPEGGSTGGSEATDGEGAVRRPCESTAGACGSGSARGKRVGTRTGTVIASGRRTVPPSRFARHLPLRGRNVGQASSCWRLEAGGWRLEALRSLAPAHPPRRAPAPSGRRTLRGGWLGGRRPGPSRVRGGHRSSRRRLQRPLRRA
jgi:hypothetical protein